MQKRPAWTRIVGLDLSKSTFVGCTLYGEDFESREHFHGEMTSDGKGYGEICRNIRDGDIALMEAGSSTFSLARHLMSESRAAEVVVLNPGRLRIIWESMRKSDKADSFKIACVARDMNRSSWPVVPVPSKDEQSERSVMTHHIFLRKQETQVFNRLFALYNSLGHPEIDKAGLKSNPELKWSIASELLSNNQFAFECAVMFNEQIDLLQGQLDVMQEKLRRICLCHPRQALAWLSLPGVGIVNAATLIAYVGDGSRFSSPDQLLNYAGLVPRQDQSGTVDKKCHITKRGCSAIRRNIVQSGQVVMLMRPACPITRFTYRKSRETPFKGKAAVAVANRLLRTGLSLLHHNSLYNPTIENGYAKLETKLRGYKLQALMEHI